MAGRFELTKFRKANSEPLTKHIGLDSAGHIVNDSAACRMPQGSAERFAVDDADGLAAFVATCGHDQALALGRLRDGVPDEVNIVTKWRLDRAAPGTIARTQTYLEFRDGAAAFAMLDFDRKGMPAAVTARIDEFGGFDKTLISIIPGLDKTMRVIRRSTSTGLFRRDTGEKFAGIGGAHLYIAVRNGRDIPRFLKTLHERCWLAGLGWFILGAAGQLLERSLIDRMVGTPERLQFEGPPLLDYPLAQDEASRQPRAIDGELLDTMTACPLLSAVERSRLERIQSAEAARLKPEAARVRQAYIVTRSQELAARTGMDQREAAKVIIKQCSGILLPSLILPFDDPEFEGCTVADVLADPERFADATLADPIEGVAYGPDKAKLFVNEDGSIIVHSFAHGQIIYRLHYDYQTAAAAVQSARDDAAKTFLRGVLNSELDPTEVEKLRNLTNEVSGLGKRTLDKALKEARQRAAEARAETLWEQKLAGIATGRPVFSAPRYNAEWRPVVAQISEVLGALRWRMPPMRDVEQGVALVQLRDLPKLHLLTSEEVNIEDD